MSKTSLKRSVDLASEEIYNTTLSEAEIQTNLEKLGNWAVMLNDWHRKNN